MKEQYFLFCNMGEVQLDHIRSDLAEQKVIPVLCWDEPTPDGGTRKVVPIFEDRDIARQFSKRNMAIMAGEEEKQNWIFGVMLGLAEHYRLCEGKVELRTLTWPNLIRHPMSVFLLEVAEEPEYRRVSNISKGRFDDAFVSPPV